MLADFRDRVWERTNERTANDPFFNQEVIFASRESLMRQLNAPVTRHDVETRTRSLRNTEMMRREREGGGGERER